MNRTIQPEIKALNSFSLIPPIRSILPNGVPLTVIQAGEQEVVRMDIVFKAGRWLQSHKLQALFTNRMLREGCVKYTASEIAEKLDYYGSWLEFSCSSEHAFITVYSLNKYMAQTLEVIETMVKEPLFPEKELQTVVDNNYQQFLVNCSKVDFLAQRQLLQSLYGEGHPCGQIAVEEDYRRITPDVLRDFYRSFYHANNCSIFLAGKVTPEMIQRVTDSFGFDLGDERPKAVTSSFEFSTSVNKRFFIERKDAMQSAVRLGNLTIDRKHPDYLQLRVLMTLFGGYFGSRLMSNIREDKGFTYGIAAGTMSYSDSGVLLVSTETANEYVEPLIQEVYHEIDKLHDELVSEEELRMVRNYMLGEMCRNYESPFSLSDAWIFIATSGLDDDYFTRSLRVTNEITPQDIREMARLYLCKDTLKEVIAGKKMG